MLKIGMYEKDITPNGVVNIPGQFYQRVSDEVESRIYANIFACSFCLSANLNTLSAK